MGCAAPFCGCIHRGENKRGEKNKKKKPLVSPRTKPRTADEKKKKRCFHGRSRPPTYSAPSLLRPCILIPSHASAPNTKRKPLLHSCEKNRAESSQVHLRMDLTISAVASVAMALGCRGIYSGIGSQPRRQHFVKRLRQKTPVCSAVL